MIKEAKLYKKEKDDHVFCFLCNHKCRIAPGKYGICGVRQNQKGDLKTLVYGEVIAAHVDPIEKKPLYHYLPGSLAFSIATVGCNFRCPFCQNWQISQSNKKDGSKAGESFMPPDIVKAALRQGCRSISYTYTEPTIYYEFAFDTARLAKEAGLGNSFVTNGYMTPEALEEIKPYLDAANVDLKAFNENFYRKMCGAHLEPVLDSIRTMKELGIWVEITTLLIPGQNDDSEELKKLAAFIAGVDPDIPWHISRYHPDYKYSESPATPIETLRNAYRIGTEAGLHYIYIGNVIGESEATLCPECGQALIQRSGYHTSKGKIKNSRCEYCGASIAGIFD